jgi:SOS-response transcriptional repressor LexA
MWWHYMDGVGNLPLMKKAVQIERRRKALRAFMEARSLKPKPWAERAKVNPNSLYNFLNGHSQSLDEETYEKLASSEHVPVFALKGDQPIHKIASAINVVGSVQAGRWSEAMLWDEGERYPIAQTLPEKWAKIAFGLEVLGNSMNLIYPESSVVVCVNLPDYGKPLISGQRVVVQRTKKDGLVEATVKELVIDGQGRQWLWPRSNDPQFQTPWNPDGAGPNIRKIEVVAVVVGSYRPEIQG